MSNETFAEMTARIDAERAAEQEAADRWTDEVDAMEDDDPPVCVERVVRGVYEGPWDSILPEPTEEYDEAAFCLAQARHWVQGIEDEHLTVREAVILANALDVEANPSAPVYAMALAYALAERIPGKIGDVLSAVPSIALGSVSAMWDAL